MNKPKVMITCSKQIRVLYEVEFYSHDGEFLGRRFIRPKKLAEQICNIWKKYGYDVNMRKMRKSEWAWINPNDIESEVK